MEYKNTCIKNIARAESGKVNPFVIRLDVFTESANGRLSDWMYNICLYETFSKESVKIDTVFPPQCQNLKEIIIMKKWFSWLLIIAFCISMLTGCDVTISAGAFGTATPSSTSSSGNAQIGKQTKTTGCVAHDGLPDSACTPGAIFANATTDQICKSGYASSVRNVPSSEKTQDYREYGITSHYSGQYEVDHLISLELGGSNDIANLWPEAASPTPGFHQKDQVENYLHAQVCSGAMSLKDAQIKIATNWLDVYNHMPKQ